MTNILSNWILIGSNAYDEYTFVPSLNKPVYRRIVDFSWVCIQLTYQDDRWQSRSVIATFTAAMTVEPLDMDSMRE
jgi:hypothetical protein